MQSRHIVPAAVAVLLGALLCAGCHDALSTAFGAALITPAELSQGGAEANVIDIRVRQDFESGHIPGSRQVAPLDLNRHLAAHHLDLTRPLVLVCYSGRSVSLMVPTATMHGYTQVQVLQGGFNAWRVAGSPMETGPVADSLPRPIPAAAKPATTDTRLPLVEWTWLQQVVASSSGTLVKLVYMILTFILIRRLYRAESTALRLLWHGLLWFFVGEAFCVLNFFVHGEGQIYTLDVAHGLGMVLMSALIPWGLYRLLDDRVLRFTDAERRCTLQPLCGHCWKKEPVVCALQRVFLFGVIACLALALIPLSSPLRPTQVAAMVLGELTEYGVPIVNHVIELRLYPLLSLPLFVATFIMLLRGGQPALRRAEPIFFAGFGLMAYPLLRHFLVNTYDTAPYWSDMWEELTELLLVGGVGWVLYLLRAQLGLSQRSRNTEEISRAG